MSIAKLETLHPLGKLRGIGANNLQARPGGRGIKPTLREYIETVSIFSHQAYLLRTPDGVQSIMYGRVIALGTVTA